MHHIHDMHASIFISPPHRITYRHYIPVDSLFSNTIHVDRRRPFYKSLNGAYIFQQTGLRTFVVIITNTFIIQTCHMELEIDRCYNININR